MRRAAALHEAAGLADTPGWRSLSAVREGRVFVLDGTSYLSRPGPRIVDGVRLLASIVHPELVTAPAGASALPLA